MRGAANISVSLLDAGPQLTDSAERDALRRSSTPGGKRGSRHVRLRRSRTWSVAPAMQEIFGRSGICAPREQGEVFPGHRCRGERGDLGVIVGGRDLDDIHSGEGEAGKAAQDRLRLPGKETADFGGSGTRCEGRVERVDIEAEID